MSGGEAPLVQEVFASNWIAPPEPQADAVEPRFSSLNMQSIIEPAIAQPISETNIGDSE